tara:strand:- start:393 stop:578 length:186 start_codon:yes stop_codon:yes gene_type:complete
MSPQIEEVITELLIVSEQINLYEWESYKELRLLLVKESRLMVQLVMMLGKDLEGRNHRFIR